MNCVERFFDSVCLSKIINLDELIKFVYTILILSKVSSKQILTNDNVSVFYYECKSLKILFSYSATDRLSNIDVSGNVFIFVGIGYSGRIT